MDLKRKPNKWVSFLKSWSNYHKFPYGAILNDKVLPYVKEDYKNNILGTYDKLSINIERKGGGNESPYFDEIRSLEDDLNFIEFAYDKDKNIMKMVEDARNKFDPWDKPISGLRKYVDQLKKDVELIHFKIDQINKKKEQIDKLKAPRK